MATLNCREVQALWVAQEEGRLPSGEAERLQAHVASCRHCAGLAVSLERLEVGLETLAFEKPEAPPYLKARIMALLGEQRARRRWFSLSFVTSRRILAVSTACLAFFAGLLARELHRVNEWAWRGGGQEVVLEFQAADARQVRLAGDFNGWGRETGPVRSETRDGRWIFRLELEPGRYNYAFIVDGRKWLPDPRAPGIIPDGFGGMNSVLYVQDKGMEKRRPL